MEVTWKNYRIVSNNRKNFGVTLMQKLLIGGLLLTLIVFGFSTITLGATSESNIAFGPGLGIPYGGIGCNLEISILDYFAVCGAFGFSPGGADVAFGTRIYLAGKDSKVRPRLGYYRGVVGYYDDWLDYENIKGSAAGCGLQFKITERFGLDGELIYILDWDCDEDLDSRYKISFGARFAF